MAVNAHQAVNPYVGYIFQGMYALIVLMDAEEHETVSVETEDDIAIRGNEKKLCNIQLKHSLNVPPALTIKNDGFWNTLNYWILNPERENQFFIFVTSAKIMANSILKDLTSKGTDRDSIARALTIEAERVVKSVKKAEASGKQSPYKDRYLPCSNYLNLTESQRKNFLERVIIKPDNINIKQVPQEISKRLCNYLRSDIRCLVVERLIEWWDRQVTLALTEERDKEIQKIELQEKIHCLSSEYRETNLPDEYSTKEPQSLDSELGSMMEKQIHIIKGGHSRINRAARVRWQARNQREKWMNDNIALTTELNEYDENLITFWRDRHGPMKDDCVGKCNDESCARGKELLDWTHLQAPNDIPPLRKDWNKPYYVQGSFQQLADELKVGWHPDYIQQLQISSGEDE